MRKNKKQPKDYTMLILTIFLGVIVIGGGGILVLSWTGIITDDTTNLMFTPKNTTHKITLNESIGTVDKIEDKN